MTTLWDSLLTQESDSRDWLNPKNWGTPRWKTAIKRPTLSLPMRNAVASGHLPKQANWLDIGCGHAQDIERLPPEYNAVGFDPYYRPKFELLDTTYPVTSLIYVLNVIESDVDRDRTLQFAFSLCTKALVLAVRTDAKESGITSIGTYQKYYKRKEFVAYVQSQCPIGRVIDVGSGHVIVIK
ncbi:hypothetical protein LC605_20770 [Nostoc sp. CHAB 5836]|uniref:hypothetical protein n=1 Tax=Nostoc sp. CHAB 5836 TaxID=2780404 RepID=UPI001E33B7BB|nr:hypothetical protein [Nostoc sp. CHAB 5836]MCC5617475.1 hypothetical protein [Nostoc sp. CHAB 5836]